MAQLRAKQIKLSAAGDILIGGVGGSGTVLAKGTAGQVLKVSAEGDVAYGMQSATDVTFASAGDLVSTTVSAAIDEVAGLAASLAGDVQDELDATQAGAGLEEDGSYEAYAAYDSETNATGAHYISTATSLKDADKILDTQIKAVADALAALGEGDLEAIQTEIDAIETATGLNSDGTLPAWSNLEITATSLKAAIEDNYEGLVSVSDGLGQLTELVDDALLGAGLGADGSYTANATANYIGAATSLADADNKLDAAIKSIADSVGALGNAFNYVGTVEGGVDAANALDLETLAAGGKDAGDYYKVATGGYFKVGASGTAFFANTNDGLVWNASAGVDIIDNTNSAVLAGANIAVTGSADTGYTVALDGIVPVANGGTGVDELADVTSGHAAITLTGGEGAVIGAVEISLDEGEISFANLKDAGTPVAGKFLKWGSAGVEYADVEASDLGVTTRVEEDFAQASAAANAVVTLTNVPAGDLAVYFNGIKLLKTGFTVNAETKAVTLVDSVNGYSVEAGDVISVSYMSVVA